MEKLLKTEELAELIKVKPSTLCRWRQAGKGPAFIKMTDNPNGAVKYDPKDVEKWLESRKQTRTQ